MYGNLKYRAKTAVGWGEFSDETSVIAARAPYTPKRPIFLSFANGELSIAINVPLDNGGSSIEKVELWADVGDDFSSDFANLPNYDGSSHTYQATTANDGLEPGKTYRFKTRAKNLIG